MSSSLHLVVESLCPATRPSPSWWACVLLGLGLAGSFIVCVNLAVIYKVWFVSLLRFISALRSLGWSRGLVTFLLAIAENGPCQVATFVADKAHSVSRQPAIRSAVAVLGTLVTLPLKTSSPSTTPPLVLLAVVALVLAPRTVGPEVSRFSIDFAAFNIGVFVRTCDAK